MTSQEQIKKIKEERRTWQTVFSSEEGKAVLAAILNRLGYFSSNQELIDPISISHANWLLNQLGIVSIQNIEKLTSSMMDSASFADIDAFEARINSEEHNV